MITTYNPFKELAAIKHELDNAIDKEYPADDIAPRCDISESTDFLTIRMELPGVAKENIRISASVDTITIEGEKSWTERSGEKYHKIERQYGHFIRSFTTGIPIDPDQITASRRDGVLEVKIPKAKHSSARKIEITD